MSIFKSKTSQNVSAGTAGGIAGGGMVYAGIKWAFPGMDDGNALALATVLGGIVIPFLSRKIAMWRNPGKAGLPSSK